MLVNICSCIVLPVYGSSAIRLFTDIILVVSTFFSETGNNIRPQLLQICSIGKHWCPWFAKYNILTLRCSGICNFVQVYDRCFDISDAEIASNDSIYIWIRAGVSMFVFGFHFYCLMNTYCASII